MRKLYFATTNKGKLSEANQILNIPIEAIHLELEEIQSLDLDRILKHKVKQAFRKIRKPVFVDDVSLEIETWNGFPGPFIKFLIQDKNPVDVLIRMMANEGNRKAVLKAGIGFFDGKKIQTFIGEINGKISKQIKGDDGWGFDPIFIPDGNKLTFAQMGREKKNKLSHRRQGLEKLKKFLDSQKNKKKL